jgi:hypothetical protein
MAKRTITNATPPLTCQVNFSTTEKDFARLEAAHIKLLGAGAHAPTAITARIVFLRGLDKMESELKRGTRRTLSTREKGGEKLL